MRLFFCLILAMLLTGCVTTEVRLVEAQKFIVVNIDPKYLQDCDMEPPPDRVNYLAAGQDEREDMMTRVLFAQYQNTKLCTADKRSLRQLIDQQKADVEAANAAEDKRIKDLGVKK